jgi:hypothetical protein
MVCFVCSEDDELVVPDIKRSFQGLAMGGPIF